jgi:hypothetical protein
MLLLLLLLSFCTDLMVNLFSPLLGSFLAAHPISFLSGVSSLLGRVEFEAVYFLPLLFLITQIFLHELPH